VRCRPDWLSASIEEIKLVETGVLFRMNLIWVVAGFIGLLWLTQVLVRRGMDDGQ
jgi:hypothetical protein